MQVSEVICIYEVAIYKFSRAVSFKNRADRSRPVYDKLTLTYRGRLAESIQST